MMKVLCAVLWLFGSWSVSMGMLDSFMPGADDKKAIEKLKKEKNDLEAKIGWRQEDLNSGYDSVSTLLNEIYLEMNNMKDEFDTSFINLKQLMNYHKIEMHEDEQESHEDEQDGVEDDDRRKQQRVALVTERARKMVDEKTKKVERGNEIDTKKIEEMRKGLEERNKAIEEQIDKLTELTKSNITTV